MFTCPEPWKVNIPSKHPRTKTLGHTSIFYMILHSQVSTHCLDCGHSYILFGGYYEDGGHRKISGLTEIYGICTYGLGSIIQDDGLYGTIQTASHELAHRLVTQMLVQNSDIASTCFQKRCCHGRSNIVNLKVPMRQSWNILQRKGLLQTDEIRQENVIALCFAIHSLGALHDSDQNNCSASDQFLMAPVPGTLDDATVLNAYVFSNCSVDAIRFWMHYLTRYR